MTRDEFINRFFGIKVWKKGDRRAPHKPLLILYALGQWERSQRRSIAYQEVDSVLGVLLEEFGPSRESYHPEYPFWRLQNDGIWKVENTVGAKTRASNNDVKKSELLKFGATGGFTPAIYDQLEQDPHLVGIIAHYLLERYFAESMHQDLLRAVGLSKVGSEVGPRAHSFQNKQPARARDPRFRSRVLEAYGERCAICGFDVRLGGSLIGIEAAHIKWHQLDGPDTTENGLALCVLHHKLFDRGAYTIDTNRVIHVSEKVGGSQGLEDWLLRFHGKEIRAPVSSRHSPRDKYLSWHYEEVFKRPARSLDPTFI